MRARLGNKLVFVTVLRDPLAQAMPRGQTVLTHEPVCRHIPPSEYGSQVALRIAATVASSDSDGAKTAVPAAHAALADAHALGLGVPANGANAAAHYRSASAGFGNAPAVASFLFAPIQAKLALGYLHEFGAGVPQDLNLAKRHYEAALEAAGPAWVPPRIAVAALRAHRAWRRAASAYPFLGALQRPVAEAVRWALHHSRRLIDPVYAFHVPTLPPSNFIPGEVGIDSFADAPPPSQPLGGTGAGATAAPADAAAPRRVPRRTGMPGFVAAGWGRVRAEVGGAIAFVKRFMRTMLMLDGGFAPSTAIIVGLLVLRIVLQFVMEALMAQGRGGANGNQGAEGAAGGAEGEEGREVGGGGDDLADDADDDALSDILVAEQPLVPSPGSMTSESGFSDTLEPGSEAPMPTTAPLAQQLPVEDGLCRSAAVGGDGAGPSTGAVLAYEGAGQAGDARDRAAGERDAMDQAVDEARRRSVAAAMARMRSQAAADAAASSQDPPAASPSSVCAEQAADSGAVAESEQPSGSAADECVGEITGEEEPVSNRLRGAGWQHDMDEGVGSEEEPESADQVGRGSGVAAATPTGGESTDSPDSGWAGFGSVAAEPAGPLAGFWAAPGAAGPAATGGSGPRPHPTAFSQLTSALRGSTGVEGFSEPSPLSHSTQAAEEQAASAPAEAAPPVCGFSFPSFDLCHDAAQASASSAPLPSPPQMTLDVSRPEARGANVLAAVQIGHSSADVGSTGYDRGFGFGSPVGDATAPGGAFAGFPLLEMPARPSGSDASGLDAPTHCGDVHMHAPPPDEDDLPDLDPTGRQTLQSITLTGHTLPVSTAAACGAAGGNMTSAPRLLEAKSSSTAVASEAESAAAGESAGGSPS